MNVLPTHFAWACVGGGEFLPPAPKRGERFGPDAVCWLCGGDTGGQGWPMDIAIKPTFTNYNNAAHLPSRTICQPCVAMQSKEAWEAYVAAHPEKGLKTGHAMSWRCYSHVFAAGLHDCPQRAGWRQWLLNPPAPPFMFVIATSGQKHLIFRAQVAHSREVFPVQFEEERVYVDRGKFAALLVDFERLYTMGFSKDQILSGEYHHGQLLKVGLRTWREAEEPMIEWRRREPGLMALAHFCGQKQEGAAAPVEEEGGPCTTASTQMTSTQQLGLF